MTCNIEELCRKEVIDIESACRLGFVGDVEVDVNTGSLVCICVFPAGAGFFRPPKPIKICWCDIVKIGDETVLVKNVPERPAPPEKRFRIPGLPGR